jgi:O-methyltransferase
MKKLVAGVLDKFGYTINRKDAESGKTEDIRNDEFWELYHFCKPYTMTSVERMFALYNSVNYVVANNIPGDFVECGVWRGGSAMLIARILQLRNISDRKLYLFDTFEGMSEPTTDDVDHRGNDAASLMEQNIGNKEESVWCLASIEDVKRNLLLTSFQPANLVFVKGKVEETLPKAGMDRIALLRLDTDWYDSTRHELIHLYPMLVVNGVLIIDDYGHWAGCRKAVDEYFREHKIDLLFNRIDYTGRLCIKTSSSSS